VCAPVSRCLPPARQFASASPPGRASQPPECADQPPERARRFWERAYRVPERASGLQDCASRPLERASQGQERARRLPGRAPALPRLAGRPPEHTCCFSKWVYRRSFCLSLVFSFSRYPMRGRSSHRKQSERERFFHRRVHELIRPSPCRCLRRSVGGVDTRSLHD
jgi:hypothetical protein